MRNEKWRQEYEKAILSGNIEYAKQIVADNAGQIRLFKFFSGTMLQLDTIMAGDFWLSNARYFNDPYDSLSLVNMRSKLVYDRNNPTERKLAYEEYDKQVKSDAVAYETQSSIFVTCLSENSLNSLHMWSYYADEHKGFCAEYSLSKLIDRGIDILPVVYTEKWEADRSAPEFNTQVALIKSIEWAQEHEWRIVCVNPNESKSSGILQNAVLPENIYVGCRDQLHINDNWSQYRELVKAFGDEKKALNYVWNNRNRRVSLNEVLDFCEKHRNKNISVYSMTLNESGFGLRKREVIY